MKEFQDLNIGVALDEGLASPDDIFTVYYTERAAWWLEMTFRGNAGHGSRFIEKTATEKFQRLINRVLEFREQEKARFKHNCSCLKLGDVTTANLTGVSGGIGKNIVPSELKAIFDFRISPTLGLKKFEEMLNSWIKEAEGDDADSGKITYEFLGTFAPDFFYSSIDREKNPWWRSFEDSCKEMELTLSPEVFPAGTDSKYIRSVDIPAFGFSPMNNTPILLHDHNEFLNEAVFLRGIDILYKIILDLANMQQ